jgi:hypothetical protein
MNLVQQLHEIERLQLHLFRSGIGAREGEQVLNQYCHLL